MAVVYIFYMSCIHVHHVYSYLVRHILAGGNTRTCNQRLFNFLLTKFEKDRDYTELCDLVKMLMDFVYLRANVDKLREGTCVYFYIVCTCCVAQHFNSTRATLGLNDTV